MRKSVLMSGVATVAMSISAAQGAVLATYDYNSFAGGVSNPSVASSLTSSLATASNQDRDAGGTGNADGLGTLTAVETRDNTPDVFTSTALLVGAGTTARNPFATAPTEILASQDYVFSTLTVTTGADQLAMTSFSFDYGVSVATSDTTGFLGAAQLFYQVNGGGFSAIGARHDRSVAAGAPGFFTGFSTATVDLASIPNLIDGDIVEFRLSFGDNSSAASTQKAHYIDNVIISGENVVPEPTTLAAVGALAVFGRRRRA